MLQLYQMGDGLALLPVMAQLLELSPEEVDACKTALRRAGVEVGGSMRRGGGRGVQCG